MPRCTAHSVNDVGEGLPHHGVTEQPHAGCSHDGIISARTQNNMQRAHLLSHKGTSTVVAPQCHLWVQVCLQQHSPRSCLQASLHTRDMQCSSAIWTWTCVSSEQGARRKGMEIARRKRRHGEATSRRGGLWGPAIGVRCKRHARMHVSLALIGSFTTAGLKIGRRVSAGVAQDTRCTSAQYALAARANLAVDSYLFRA
jgi:hypothetical protein